MVWISQVSQLQLTGGASTLVMYVFFSSPSGTSPTLVEYPVNQRVTEGSSLVLTCRVLGLPTPRVNWEMNGILDGTNLFGSLGSAVLNISVVSPQHSGNYTCTASQGGGSPVTFPIVTITVACE